MRPKVGAGMGAKYWGLIVELPPQGDQKSSGHWKLTRTGVEFVRNEVGIPEWAIVYDDRVLRYEGKTVRISEAIKKKFDYEEVMQAVC